MYFFLSSRNVVPFSYLQHTVKVSFKKYCHLWPASGIRAGPRVYRAPARVSWPAPRVAPWVTSPFPRTIETLLSGVAAGRRIVVGPEVVVVVILLLVLLLLLLTLSLGQQCAERSQGCRGSSQAGSDCKEEVSIVGVEMVGMRLSSCRLCFLG